ncbi:response regulator transcription factor [Streptococcus anginosus]|uniref:response regulator transcription factor n=1 Tax=Streptococcus anginosus TaxID=1328 RepID=UPI001899CA27|nr:response regulator transcription factor [Streptococcus anginosus]MDB8661319.1 response regulator transcription factor [Streptococcus anginosus]
MANRILLVEKEKKLAQFIGLELQKEGYRVDLFETGKDALASARANQYDLFLLNFMLDDLTGTEFAAQLSVIKPASVIIVLDNRDNILQYTEEIQRFAVAYMVEPFIVTDLVEKISAIFRGRDFIDQHCSQMKVPTSYRNLRIDVQNHTVYRGEEVIALTRREYDLLATLMGSHQALSREQLLERVWKYEGAVETNVVDVYIRYLRSKIDIAVQKSYIKTVRGVGYAMQE